MPGFFLFEAECFELIMNNGFIGWMRKIVILWATILTKMLKCSQFGHIYQLTLKNMDFILSYKGKLFFNMLYII